MKKPKEEEKNVKNATRIIMYCKTKKIFVLFHVQNEKFREKNTIMLFYFNPHPNSTRVFSDLIFENFNFPADFHIHFLFGYLVRIEVTRIRRRKTCTPRGRNES